MRRSRSIVILSTLAVGLSALAALPAAAATRGGDDPGGEQQYVVLFNQSASPADAAAAVEAAGGSILSQNTDIGVATITTTNPDFVRNAADQAVIEGTAPNRVIGEVPQARKAAAVNKKVDQAEAEVREAAGTVAPNATTPDAARKTPNAEPLASLQWDMQAIGATVDGSYKYEQGSKRVLVGIIDTGIDGSHPDIAPNFDAKDSRNFTVDIPYDANGAVVDGPCPEPSCIDPADVDRNGHGTHVASTIGSPINGIGIAGVAPNVTLVNLRAGQSSGFFFLQPSLDALTYAGRIGIDVVNMSYYVDPWLFNCVSNPADSPEAQQEQRTVITAMQRALDFARIRGVTLVSAAGNGATDYTKPLVDASSPDFASFPGQTPYTRQIDPDNCTSMPSEGRGVISVSSTGPSGRKAYYSDYGNGYIDVAAPGGDVYDTPTNTRSYAAGILAAYPAALAKADGAIDDNGNVVVPWAVKSCDASGAVCGYYQYLQGTSMASPHAVGVAALIVSKYGIPDFIRGGKYLPAFLVDARLRQSAVATACPNPRDYTYTRVLPSGATVTATHTCEGTKSHNGFYGSGIVNALRAIGR